MNGTAQHNSPNTIVDKLSLAVGHGVAWLTLAMVLVTLVIVVLRYVFGAGRVWLQESVTWMHAVVFMLGAAYTLQAQDHVRVDVFYRKMTDRGRAWVDALGTLLFLLPLCGYLIYESLNYVGTAISIGESSREAGGLPGLFLLKACIPLMAFMVTLQGLGELRRAIRVLRG